MLNELKTVVQIRDYLELLSFLMLICILTFNFAPSNLICKINFLKKFLQEHFQSVKWFGSGSGQLSWSKLIAKVISRKKLPLARKVLVVCNHWKFTKMKPVHFAHVSYLAK